MSILLARFERIEIISTVGDGNRPNHIWLLLHWFSGSQPKPCRAMPLRNAIGSAALVAGDVIPSFSCACELSPADPEPVTVAFMIVELGACPPAGQPRRAKSLNTKVAEVLSEAYVEAAEWSAEAHGIARADSFAKDGAALPPPVAEEVTSAFVEEALARLGRSAWPELGLAPVLHGVVAFVPTPELPCRTLELGDASHGQGTGNARIRLRMTLEHRAREGSLPAAQPLPVA